MYPDELGCLNKDQRKNWESHKRFLIQWYQKDPEILNRLILTNEQKQYLRNNTPKGEELPGRE